MISFSEKCYNSFSEIERVNLIIAALSRGDKEDVASIRHNSPIIEYKLSAPQFANSLEDIGKIIGLFCLICESYCNKILIARANLNASIASFKVIDMMTFNAIEDLDEQINIVQDMKQILEYRDYVQTSISSHLSYIKSAYDALEQFCVGTGLNYDHLIQWLDIPLFEDIPIGADKSLIGLAKCCDDSVGQIKELFLSCWRGRL